MERRTILKGAAWSVPAIALAVAAPQATASTNHPQPCIYTGQSGLIVTVLPDAIIIQTKAGDSNAIDVTLRQAGMPEYHRNFVTQGKNPGDNQVLYKPGESITIPLPRPWAKGDWGQIKDIHITDPCS